MRILTLAATAAFTAACSTSGTSVRIGEAGNHPATDPEGIILLIQPPEKPHQVIALVEGTAATDDYFTKARTEAAALKAMKEEAARLGANAIVLTGKNSAPYGQVGFATTSATATSAGGYASGFGTTVSTVGGWEKITFSGAAVRYNEAN